MHCKCTWNKHDGYILNVPEAGVSPLITWGRLQQRKWTCNCPEQNVKRTNLSRKGKFEKKKNVPGYFSPLLIFHLKRFYEKKQCKMKIKFIPQICWYRFKTGGKYFIPLHIFHNNSIYTQRGCCQNLRKVEGTRVQIMVFLIYGCPASV